MHGTIALPTRQYLLSLALGTVGFLAAHLVLNYFNYHVEELPWLLLQLFELDEENNLPTWFSSFLLLNNAVILWLAAGVAISNRLHWRVLAFGFLVLAIDEVAGLHETFHTSIDDNWTIYAAPLVLLVGLYFIPFLLSLPRRIAVWFVVSGALYVGGALGVEWLAQDMEEDTWSYSLAVLVEEGAEMIGALLFLVVNLLHLRAQKPVLELQFK